MKKTIAFLTVLIILCTCCISAFASDKVAKSDVLSKINTLSYDDTYYLTEYGDADSTYECYKNSEDVGGVPAFVFFKNGYLVDNAKTIAKLSQIAVVNHAEEYYYTWLNNIDTIDDGLNSAKWTEVCMLVGKYSSELAGTLISSGIMSGVSTLPSGAKGVISNALKQYGVSGLTGLITDVENNIDAFNITFTHTTIEEAAELKKQLMVMNVWDKKTYAGATIACDRLQKIHENVEMATVMFSQIAYDSPTISDYGKSIASGFVSGVTSGFFDSVFFGEKLDSIPDRVKYLNGLIDGGGDLEKFYKVTRILYILESANKVAFKNTKYVYDLLVQLKEAFPYAERIVEKYEYANQYNYIKTATMMNKFLLQNNGYKIVYESNNGSSGGTSDDSVSDNYDSSENESYVSNYTLSSGTLDLDGKTMYVNGDFIHTGGTLNLGSGKLVIFGDYYITSSDRKSYGFGLLNMTDEDGHILVYGDFAIDSGSEHDGYLTAGTLEIKGDFTQRATPYYSSGWPGNQGAIADDFKTSGTHKVILSGAGEQIIKFENPNQSCFNILEVKNKTGLIKFEQLPIVKEIIGDIISNNDINICNSNITISKQTIKAPNIYYSGSKLILSENAKLDTNVIQTSGTITVIGKSEITGDYYITSSDRKSYGFGLLNMTDEDGHILVYGDFAIDSGSEHGGYLTAGTLEIKGDFTQRATPYYSSGWPGNQGAIADDFKTSGTHKVILSGAGEQIIKFENPNQSCFNILINQNPNGVIFATSYNYNELQTIYPFDFEVVEYDSETNQINVDVIMSEDLQSLNGNVIISLYDASNKLIECRIKELSELEQQTFNGLNDYDGSYVVSAFYWADITSIKPLCLPIQKELSTK